MSSVAVLARLRDALRSAVGIGARSALPALSWCDDGERAADLECPNCAAGGSKPLVVTIDFKPPRRRRQSFRVVACDACGCRFYQAPPHADYAADEMLTRGRASLYLQQGAGLAQLCRPLAGLARPPGARFLDIGCGFGFGLDFAVRALGWVGQGMDPAQVARWGSERLGLRIEPRLLTAEEPELSAAFDVVMAAETLEHVASPMDFIRRLGGCLAPGGVLVLTTPDAELVVPGSPPGQLAGLLSPELHVVLQSEASLRFLLREAGFTDVSIVRDGGALIATASQTKQSTNAGAEPFERVLLDHLESRAGGFTPDDDLFWGFLGRAFAEAVNHADLDRAARIRPRLAAACLSRFAIDLDHPALPTATTRCDLATMAVLVPLNLAAILFADAMLLLAGGCDRPSLRHRLDCAASAAQRLQRAVAELAMADPMSEELGWVSAAEAVLCQAADPLSADVVMTLKALPPAPGNDRRRRTAMMVRAFVTMVNAGRYPEASALWRHERLDSDIAVLGRDATFCRAVLDLQPEGDPREAAAGFAWVCDDLKAVGPVQSDLFEQASQGLALAQAKLVQPVQD